ncbi:hypothetical protein [Parasphaerochaeta coccoides]|uniref:Outer membrane protein beta-barrel domain-containing protein n=1 Tax=Parasphaerochaeta coccoides (strain ATCC BAA-1237 / DSM 17374 / SPN1) TaxID=760011 RepID=F4GI68_PARC1|nr:hypothetical protein [Parasphaerochaeta coccoides]AEC02666.1 hypothetical protein Spico_1463 [Parasphaerochaeta coccoides DSM 17374]
MRFLFLLCTIICILSPVYGTEQMSWGGAVDVLSCDGFMAGDWEIGADLRLTVLPGCEVRLPLGLDVGKKGCVLFSAGIAAAYYPWHTGPFILLSLMRLGFLFDRGVVGGMLMLDEISLGWTFLARKHWIVEPVITFRDPSHSYQDEFASIKESLQGYRTIRVGLRVGFVTGNGNKTT